MLTIITGIISYPLCRSTHYSFKPDYAIVIYMKDHNIQSNQTEKEMGTIKLQFLYLCLALSDHIICLELNDKSNQVILNSSLMLVANDEPRLSDNLIQKMKLILKSDSKQEEMLAQVQAYEQSGNFEMICTSAFLEVLDSVPPQWLKGNLAGLKFTSDIAQETLTSYAPNYQNW